MFHKHLSTFDATMIVAGSMIGSGIFIVSADIARVVQNPILLMAVWVVTGLLTLIAALTYGELAGMMPEAGGQYVYLREAFGPLAGFLYGWTLFTVIQTGTIAAVAMAFAKFTAVFIPWFSEKNILLDIGIQQISAAHLLAISSIILLTIINARGVALGKIVQNVFTSTKVIAVVGLGIIGIIIGLGSETFTANLALPTLPVGTSGMFGIASLIAVAMVGSIFSSDAWNNITFVAAEVKDPKKSIPRALLFGVLIVTSLYLLVNLAYIALLPMGGSAEGATVVERGMSYALQDRVGTAAAEVMFGVQGGAIMALLIIVSTFGCNNGLILSGARAYWAMASHKLFFKGASELNDKHVPAKGLYIQAVWISVLCLSGQYGDLLDYVVFAVLLFYIATIVGVFVLRKKRPDVHRPYKAFGYPVLPAIYIIAATFICGVLLVEKPNYTWPGLYIVAAGVPIYFLWKFFNKEPTKKNQQ
ncbi:MAG: amino acid permease [Ignavibacteria bacterium]|nr:amino acid permease [Ignavibacteria bacterium]